MALDVEDYMVFSAITDEGEPLDQSQCRRLFTLPALEGNSLRSEFDDSQKNRLSKLFVAQKKLIIDEVAERNLQFSRQELSKLDRWCEDQRSSLRHLLNALENQIRDKKRQARLSLSLTETLKCQREWLNLDTKREAAWKQYYHAEKDVVARKSQLMDCIRKKMEQEIVEQPLFTLRWCIT